MKYKFQVGELVWAQLKYWPAWPAKIVDPPVGANRKRSYYVFFYGTENFGWIEKKKVCSYREFALKKDWNNSSYQKACKDIAQVFHEEIQLNSPTFRETYGKEVKKHEEIKNSPAVKRLFTNKEVGKEEDSEVQPQGFDIKPKPKRTKEEEEERQKKIRQRLKVRFFPKASPRKKIQKSKNSHKGNKSAKSKAACTSEAAYTSDTSSSCIITVHVRDYKKVIPLEVFVYLQRCDEGLPQLCTDDSDEPNSSPKEEKPPTLEANI